MENVLESSASILEVATSHRITSVGKVIYRLHFADGVWDFMLT